MTEPDGRAGQEAARLLAAAQDWLRTSAPHLAPVAEDGEPCSCPLCRAVVGLREADPDTLSRWVDAAVTGVSAALAQAAAAASDLTPSGPPSATTTSTSADDGAEPASASGDPAGPDVGHDGPSGRGVRRIRLDGDVGPDLP
jgi:hypothetical protein